jgi:hypothetical protein
LMAPDGLVEEVFTWHALEGDRLSCAWSVVSCLSSAMGDPQTAATVTVMRAATLRRCASEAWLRDVEILPIESEVFRFYRLRP